MSPKVNLLSTRAFLMFCMSSVIEQQLCRIKEAQVQNYVVARSGCCALANFPVSSKLVKYAKVLTILFKSMSRSLLIWLLESQAVGLIVLRSLYNTSPHRERRNYS